MAEITKGKFGKRRDFLKELRVQTGGRIGPNLNCDNEESFRKAVEWAVQGLPPKTQAKRLEEMEALLRSESPR